MEPRVCAWQGSRLIAIKRRQSVARVGRPHGVAGVGPANHADHQMSASPTLSAQVILGWTVDSLK